MDDLAVTSLKLELFEVHPEQLAEVWQQVSGYLKSALDVAEGEYKPADLRKLCETGAATLIVGVRGVQVVGGAIVQLISYPTYCVAHVTAVGGDRLFVDHEHMDKLRLWAKSKGCSQVQGYCKPSRARLWRRLGMDARYIVMRSEV